MFNRKIIQFIFILHSFFGFSLQIEFVQPKIAIVGAGISGTSAAYFLSKNAELNPKIDIYSNSEEVGGRLQTVFLAENLYETGGSILHPRNLYMKKFVEEFGLKPKKGISGKFGLYDGTQFVYTQSNWDILNTVSLFWRYGISLLKLDGLIGGMLNKFERIYHTQDEGFAFSNVADLLSAMDPTFNLMLERSLRDGLREAGISDLLIDELAVAVMRVNYGQLVDAHQFVGSVSLAGAESGLWSVHGGNKKVPQSLLNASGAHLITEEVEAIQLTLDGRFKLRLKDTENDDTPIYDSVIVATPLTSDTSAMRFEKFPQPFKFTGRFHRTVCTMVSGEINYKTFGFTDRDSVMDEIFTTNATLFFNSIGRNYPVDLDDGLYGAPSVWKVFSNNLLTEDELGTLFQTINETRVIDWLAYPEYDGSQTSGNFTLYPGLYYINTIEFAASAMEMGVIGARNAALLAASHFGVDIQDRRSQNYHVEL